MDRSQDEIVTDHLSGFNAKDVLYALICSDLYVRNISSQIKHLYWFQCFVSISPEKFSKKRLNSYNQIKDFLESLYSIAPSFQMLEDYVPERDWGDVFYLYNKRPYGIFFGNSISNVVDYYRLFEFIFFPLDAEYLQEHGISPQIFFQSMLTLQHEITSTIQQDVGDESIETGHLEIPPLAFWNSVKKFLNKNNFSAKLDKSFLKEFCVELGEYKKENILESISDSVFNENIDVPLFVRLKGKIYPILARRTFDETFKRFIRNYLDLKNNDTIDLDKIKLKSNGYIYRYCKKRFFKNSVFGPLSTASESDVSDLIYPVALHSKHTIYLIYMLGPFFNTDDFNSEIVELERKLIDSISIWGESIPRFFLPLEGNFLEIRSDDERLKLDVNIIAIAPPNSLSFGFKVRLFDSSKIRLMLFDQFIGLIDELDNIDSLSAFLDYGDQHMKTLGGMVSTLDIYGSFLASHGVLIEGASTPNFISLDPHWGSNRRFETLKKFWSQFPVNRCQLFDPESWKIEEKDDETIRGVSRKEINTFLYHRFDNSDLLFSAPFPDLSYEEGEMTDLFIRYLEDYFSQLKNKMGEYAFENKTIGINVFCLPKTFIERDSEFKRSLGEIPYNDFLRVDSRYDDESFLNIRIMFDNEMYNENLIKADTKESEITTFIVILEHLRKLLTNRNIDSIITYFENKKNEKPRYKKQAIEKLAAFPEYGVPWKPESINFKKAIKKIAFLTKESEFEPGTYRLDESKSKIRVLIEKTYSEINKKVAKYSAEESIPLLIRATDSIVSEFEYTRERLSLSLSHEVDFDRGADYADNHSDFIRNHRNYRYLIEKFVQLQPTGKDPISEVQFKDLIGLIDWYLVLVSASDALHYDINPGGLTVDYDYKVDVIYEGHEERHAKALVREDALYNFGLLGNPDDRVNVETPIEEILEKLNSAFLADLGFGYKILVSLLHVLAKWPNVHEEMSEDYCYVATKEEIVLRCQEAIPDSDDTQIESALNFLILEKDQILRVTGQNNLCLEIPTWEHNKRPARYTLRPIIELNDQLFWGAFSCYKSGMLWSQVISSGTMPYEAGTKNIDKILSLKRKEEQKLLEQKTQKILTNLTPYSKPNCQLHKLNKQAGHPLELGDYDVLAYLPKAQVVLNIECKDLDRPYCMKDTKRLRDKIFGRPGKNDGHFFKINRREKYLQDNMEGIFGDLKWPIFDRKPEVITIYLTRELYFWTKFPPENINARFLRVDSLGSYIQEILN